MKNVTFLWILFQNKFLVQAKYFKKSIMAQNYIKCQNKSIKITILQAGRHFLMWNEEKIPIFWKSICFRGRRVSHLAKWGMKLTLSREKKNLFHTKKSNTFQEGWVSIGKKNLLLLFLRPNTDFQVVFPPIFELLNCWNPSPDKL